MFDPYYETKVNLKWGNSLIGIMLGLLQILIGIFAFSFTMVDLTNGMTAENSSAWQENSIWPTIGKGIWVGAILFATGLIGIISNCERTQVSLYIYNGLNWISTVFSIFLLASSILHVHPYMVQGFQDPLSRTVPMNIELTFNSLLMACGALGFIVSLSAAILTCIAGKCCLNRRKYQILDNRGLPLNFQPRFLSPMRR